MNFFRDISIKFKVFLPPAILALALILVAALSLYRMHKQQSVLRRVHDIALKKITLIDEFILISEQVQSNVFNISVHRIMNLHNEEAEIMHQKLIQGLSDLNVIYGEILTKWELDKKEQILLEKIKRLMDIYRLHAQQAAMSVLDKPSFGVFLVHSSIIPFKEFQAASGKFLDYQKAKIIRAETQSRENARRIGIIIMLMTGIIVLTSIVGTFLISSSLISRPIYQIATMMHDLANGDLSIEVQSLKRRDELGSMVRALEIFKHNAVEKALLDEALRISEFRYRRLFETAKDGIILLNGDTGQITDINPFIKEMLHYEDEQLLGKRIWEIKPFKDIKINRKILEVLKTENITYYEYVQLETKEGAPVDVDLVCNFYWVNNQKVVQCNLRDIRKRKKAEKDLKLYTHHLELINRANKAFSSTLDLEEVLGLILKEVQHMFSATTVSVWFIDPASKELVCSQATGLKHEILSELRIPYGHGIIGWVADANQSKIVRNIYKDPHHSSEMLKKTTLDIQSLLVVPLRVKDNVIGILAVGDIKADRFQKTDKTLLESLAATASFAIENARLFEQAKQDAETMSVLLREVNHRVKNNLAAMIGLIYTEKRYKKTMVKQDYISFMDDLIHRIQGLASVHKLLSGSEWAPLYLNTLIEHIVGSSLKMLSPEEHINIKIYPSNILITPDQAHNLSIVLNELMTNAMKHGVQNQNSAQINIMSELDENMMKLKFSDNGPGYPTDIVNQKNFSMGFDLIYNIVKKNLHGELNLYNNSGAVAEICFKLRGTEESG